MTGFIPVDVDESGGSQLGRECCPVKAIPEVVAMINVGDA
jgi:hypothetical protein